MVVTFTRRTGSVSAPPLAPGERPIDLDHLSRMTLGERALEREVLTLFDRQAAMLTHKMRDAEPAIVAAHAHTLKGSAQGIGAFAVAGAAGAVEAAAAASDRRALAAAMSELAAAIGEARRAIDELLRAP